MDSVGRAAEHGKTQRDDTIATRNRLQMGSIEASRIIRVACESIGVTLDNGLCDCVVVGREHLQHECYEAISSRRILQLLRIGARCAYVKTILLVGYTLAYFSADGDACILVNVEIQSDDAIAPFTSSQLQRIDVFSEDRARNVESILRIGIPQGNRVEQFDGSVYTRFANLKADFSEVGSRITFADQLGSTVTTCPYTIVSLVRFRHILEIE